MSGHQRFFPEPDVHCRLSHLIAQANSGHVSGPRRVGRMKLYPRNGTGLWSHVTLRLFTPSEITGFRPTRAR